MAAEMIGGRIMKMRSGLPNANDLITGCGNHKRATPGNVFRSSMLTVYCKIPSSVATKLLKTELVLW